MLMCQRETRSPAGTSTTGGGCHGHVSGTTFCPNRTSTATATNNRYSPGSGTAGEGSVLKTLLSIA